MVILRIVFEDFGFLLIFEIANQLIDAKVFSPFFAVDKPVVGLARILVASREQFHIFLASSTLNFLARKNRSYEHESEGQIYNGRADKRTRHKVSSRSE